MTSNETKPLNGKPCDLIQENNAFVHNDINIYTKYNLPYCIVNITHPINE